MNTNAEHDLNVYDRRGLLAEVRRGFMLDWAGHHGANHWGRVRCHALAIARARGADVLVAELFAFLHDSQRQDEWKDPGHGARGAEYARALQGRFFDLRPAQIDRLAHAIRHHSGGEVSTDATIQTCWDADRLDLGRVRIKPSDEYLSEEGTRRISLAYAWSRGHARRHDKYSVGSIFEPARWLDTEYRETIPGVAHLTSRGSSPNCGPEQFAQIR